MKKKVLVLVGLITYPFLAFSSPCYSVTKDNANVRVDSTTTSPSLGNLAQNDIVEVLDEKYGWYKIILPKKFSCYVSAEYVKEIAPGKVEVTGSKVNLRAKPALKSDILGQAQKGATFVMIEKTDQWVKIQGYPYIKGWVHSMFLKKCNEAKEPEAFNEVGQ
jgi:uncharacterized protein YgiM (DUF1202 family)